MPNFTSTHRAKTIAQSIARVRGAPEIVVQRIAHLAYLDLIHDSRNARRASAADLARGEPWVQDAVAAGRQLDAFVLRRPARARIQALRLKAAQLGAANRRLNLEIMSRIGWLEDHCDRMNLAEIERVIDAINAQAAAHFNAQRADLVRPVCEPAHCVSSSGNCWNRLISLAQLHDRGRRLHNCCDDRNARSRVYANLMRSGAAEFWELSDPAGACVGLAMIAPGPGLVREFGGFANGLLPDRRDLPAIVEYAHTHATTPATQPQEPHRRRRLRTAPASRATFQPPPIDELDGPTPPARLQSPN